MKLAALSLGWLMVMVGIAMAQPSLGPDCPVGTTVLAGSNTTAGKVTMGPYGGSGTCTLSFVANKIHSCVATNETNSGGFAAPEGGKTTPIVGGFDMVIGSQFGWVTGDVISYLCNPF